MSQDYPPYDDQETRRRPNPASRQAADRVPPPGPMARPVLPRAARTQAHPPASGEPLPPEPESSALYVPWWGFVLVILAVAGITCGLWGVVLMSRGDAATSIGPTPTPIFVVITATPTLGAAPIVVTSTPPSLPGTALTAGPQPSVGPQTTPAPGSTPAAGTSIPITLGATIMVTGTGGQGLTVRQGPGTDYTYIFVANDGDKFVVKDGPRQANGYTWWYIVDPTNANRFGWAVQDYMQVVP